MEPFVTDLYTWNSCILPVIAFNYFAHFFGRFYWLINTRKGKGSLCKNCVQKSVLQGRSGIRLNFVVPVKLFAVFRKPSQFTLEGIVAIVSAGSWPVFHGWQVRCLKNSGLSILLWKDQLKSSQGWSLLCSLCCVVVVWLCIWKETYFNPIPYSVVYITYFTPNNPCDFHRRNKTLK